MLMCLQSVLAYTVCDRACIPDDDCVVQAQVLHFRCCGCSFSQSTASGGVSSCSNQPTCRQTRTCCSMCSPASDCLQITACCRSGNDPMVMQTRAQRLWKLQVLCCLVLVIRSRECQVRLTCGIVVPFACPQNSCNEQLEYLQLFMRHLQGSATISESKLC